MPTQRSRASTPRLGSMASLPFSGDFAGGGTIARPAAGSANGGIYWAPDVSGIINNIRLMRVRTLQRSRERFYALAPEMEAFMKRNHWWENRSGAAEASLVAVPTDRGFHTFGSGGSFANQSFADEFAIELGFDLGTLLALQDPPRGRDYSIYLNAVQSPIGDAIAAYEDDVMQAFDGAMTL